MVTLTDVSYARQQVPTGPTRASKEFFIVRWVDGRGGRHEQTYHGEVANLIAWMRKYPDRKFTRAAVVTRVECDLSEA